MKKFILLAIMALSSTAINAQIKIGNGTSWGNAPVMGSYDYSYSQSIYPKASIGSAGNITGLTYTAISTTATFKNTNNIQVWLGHTSKSVFTDSNDFLPVSAMTKVFEGTISNNAGKVTITFSTPFAYNNSDNLVIAVNEIGAGAGSSGDKFNSTLAPSRSAIQAYYYFGSAPIDPTNISAGASKAALDYLPNVTLLGLTAQAAVPQCSTVTSPANMATNVVFLPRVDYTASAGATKYFVTVGTTPGGNDIEDHYDNGAYQDFYFAEGLMPETTYYVKVVPANANGEAIGCTYTSFTTGKAVANDNCSTAEAITSLPVSKAVDATYTSTMGMPVECGGVPVANDGLWYSFVGTGDKIEVKAEATDYWDPMIVVKEGSCAATNCLVSVDDTSYGETETGVFQSQVGVTYYINIGSSGPFDLPAGTFNLSVKSLGNMATKDKDVKSKSIVISPNPVQDIVNMTGDLSSFDHYQILNTTGQIVQQGSLKQQKNIAVERLRTGMYLLTLKGSVDSKTVKFIKK